MRKVRLASLLGAGAVLALGLSGCPLLLPDSYDIWIVNTSNAATITNVKLISNVDPNQVIEYPEDQAPNSTRVIENVRLDQLPPGTISVEITGDNGQEPFDDVDATVNVPDTLEDGMTIVLAVTGNSILDFGAEYVPLEEASKGMLMLRKHTLKAAAK